MDRRQFLLGVPLSGAVLLSSRASAATSPTVITGDHALAGVTGVYVTVGTLSADAEADGLSAADIQSFIIKRLANSKINTVTYDQFIKEATLLNLFYDVETCKEAGVYGYYTQLSILELVTPAFPVNTLVNGTIWSVSHVGVVSAQVLSQIKEISIAADVDNFITAYFKVNPAPAF